MSVVEGRILKQLKKVKMGFKNKWDHELERRRNAMRLERMAMSSIQK